MAQVTITLKHKQLLYDIQNSSYIVGLNRSNGSNFEDVSNIQNTGEGGELDMMLRSIETAFGEIKRNVNRFIVDNTNETDTPNTPITVDTGEFTLTLDMPGNFNLAAVDSIKSAAHEYIVSSALYDWFTAVKPDEIKIYEQRKIEASIDLLSAVYRKQSPTRPL